MAGPVSSTLRSLLVVGLGNTTHPGTRHSVGHSVLDALAWSQGLQLKSTREGDLGESDVELNHELWRLYFFKPKRLMNILGPDVRTVLRSTVSLPSRMVVIHDELRLPPCTLKHRLGDKPIGHGGIKSITKALGDNNYYRMQIGIGSAGGGDVPAYVLGRMGAQEKVFWSVDGEGTAKAWTAMEKIARQVVKAEADQTKAQDGP